MPQTHDPVTDKSTQLIHELYVAINEFDLPKLRSLLRPDFYREEFEGSTRATTNRGVEEFMRATEQARANWGEGGCTPQRLEVFDAKKILVDVHVRVKIKATGDWAEGPVIDGFAFREGLICEFHSFVDRERALAWAES